MTIQIDRRKWVFGSASLLGLTALYPAGSLLAAQRQRTPRQTEGPFYPLARPDLIDPDLIHVAGQTGVAHGEITHLTGRVIDQDGTPYAGVKVEIWQVNGYGRYNDARDASDRPLDHRFKGYGTSLTGQDGAYRFLTIKPVTYPGRTPHIHFALSGGPIRRFITQMYVEGAPQNERDVLLRHLSKAERDALLVPLTKNPAGEWNAVFDIVLEKKA